MQCWNVMRGSERACICLAMKFNSALLWLIGISVASIYVLIACSKVSIDFKSCKRINFGISSTMLVILVKESAKFSKSLQLHRFITVQIDGSNIYEKLENKFGVFRVNVGRFCVTHCINKHSTDWLLLIFLSARDSQIKIIKSFTLMVLKTFVFIEIVVWWSLKFFLKEQINFDS